MIGVVVLSLLAQLLGVLLPVSLGKFIGQIFTYHPLRGRWLEGLPQGWFDTMSHFSLFLGGLLLCKALADLGLRYWRRRLSLDWVISLQEALFAKHLRISTAEYHQKGTGRYLLRWSGDLSSLRSWLELGVFQAIADGILLCLALVWLLSRFPQVMVWWLPALAVLGLALHFVVGRVYEASRSRRDIRSRVVRYVQQCLQGIETVQSHNRIVPEQKRMERLLRKTRRQELRYAAWQGVVQALAPALVYLLLGLLLVSCALNPPVEQGELLSALLLLITLMPMGRRLLRVGIYWANGRIAAHKLEQLLDLPEVATGTKRYQYQKGQIELKALTFSYPGEGPELGFADYSVSGPGVYHWPLPPGGGKTTLLRLLTGLYIPRPGQLFLDGQDVSQLDGKSLRRHIAVVSPAWPLLGRTVFEAVSYSRSPRRRPQVQVWLDRLQANLPYDHRLTLDQPIGEGSCQLSMAQAMLLRYVRAFLTQKPLLLVECSGDLLDPRVRPLVDLCLKEWGASRTVLRVGAALQTHSYANQY